MRLIKIIAMLVAAGLLAGCSGGSGNSKDFSAISTTIIQDNVGNYTLARQTVAIDLGSLHYWRLQVVGHDSTCTSHTIGLGAKQIADPSSVKYLDTSHGITVGDVTFSSGCSGGNFTTQLVAGSYFLTVDGQPTPVTITVAGGNPSAPTTTKAS